MTAAPLPPQEYERLMALARFEILDTLPEERFDRLTALTADVLDVPVAIINLVDQFRQWGKSCVGLGGSEAPREVSFCAWTILQDDVLVIENAAADPRFTHNPMVTGMPHIWLYAGAPLITDDGLHIGTLCVTDDHPHHFGARERRILRSLADLTMQALEDRLRERELAREVDTVTAQVSVLQRSASDVRILAEVSGAAQEAGTPEGILLNGLQPLAQVMPTAWLGVACVQSGEARVLHGWHGAVPPELDGEALRHVTRAFLLSHQFSRFLGLTEIQAWRARERRPLAVAGDIKAAAVLHLGYDGEKAYLLLLTRTDVDRWHADDRTLLEAVARTLRGTLDRQVQLRAATAAARTDALTRLPNRRAFDEDLALVAASGSPYRLGLIDLDGMKAVNDTEGHDRGDMLLQLFAQALGAELGHAGRTYRLGGDEFAFLTTEDAALWPDEALLEQVDLAVVAVRALSFSGVGASAGIAAAQKGSSSAEVLAQADARMYAQKKRKRARRDEYNLREGKPRAQSERATSS